MAAQTFASKQYRKRVLREVALGWADDDVTPTTITYHAVNSRGITLSPEVVQIITQGTIQRYTDEDMRSYTVQLDQDVYDSVFNEMWLPKTAAPVDVGGDYVIETRYHGVGHPKTKPLVEVRFKLEMINIADGKLRTEYVRFLKCQVRQYMPFQTAQAEALVAPMVVLEAQITTLDIAGVAVTGVNPNGEFWVLDAIADA